MAFALHLSLLAVSVRGQPGVAPPSDGGLALGAHEMPHDGRNTFDAGGGGACKYQYRTHDKHPVVISAQCAISKKDLDKGTEPGHAVRDYVHVLGGHDGCTNDDAGHILANQLGGKAEPTNLFPQSPHLNRGAWEQFEAAIRSCMNGASTAAKLSWTFTYASDTHTRPTAASYSVSYDKGCSAAHQTFSNPCDKDLVEDSYQFV